jgi:hypothetical protein
MAWFAVVLLLLLEAFHSARLPEAWILSYESNTASNGQEQASDEDNREADAFLNSGVQKQENPNDSCNDQDAGDDR